MSFLAVPRVNPDRCPVHESPARMSTYRHARRVLRPNRIKETSRSSHERGHAHTPRCLGRAAVTWLLAARCQCAGNRIKDLLLQQISHASPMHPPTPTFLLPFIPICLTQQVTATAPVLACMTWSVQNALPVVILGTGGELETDGDDDDDDNDTKRRKPA